MLATPVRLLTPRHYANLRLVRSFIYAMFMMRHERFTYVYTAVCLVTSLIHCSEPTYGRHGIDADYGHALVYAVDDTITAIR